MHTRSIVLVLAAGALHACTSGSSECDRFAQQVLAEQENNPLAKLVASNDAEKKVFADVFPKELCSCLEPKLADRSLEVLVQEDEEGVQECSFSAGKKVREAIAAMTGDGPAEPVEQIEFCGETYDANTSMVSCYDEVASLEALSGFTALKQLDLGSLQGGDLSPIARFTDLTGLKLYGPGVKDLEVLKAFK
ncbi:MAG: hypothetical protein AAFQ82_24690, partial [Myxococcota bacterium]